MTRLKLDCKTCLVILPLGGLTLLAVTLAILAGIGDPAGSAGWRAGVALALLIPLFSLGFAYVFARRVDHSLSTIFEVMTRVADGDLDARITATLPGKARTLADNMNRMLDRMAIGREANLAESHRNAIILDTVGDSIYCVDQEGRLTFVNKAMEALTGWPAAEALGQPVHPLIHHTHVDGRPYPREECPLYQAYLEGRPLHVDDEQFWRRDGTPFDVECTTMPFMDDGRFMGAVAVFRDITERKRHQRAIEESNASLREAVRRLEEAQNQLLQSEKMASIGQLAAGVAHEINNPTSFVQANLGVLDDYLRDLLALLAEYEQVESALPAETAERLRERKAALDIDYLRRDAPSLLRESQDGIGRVRRIVQDLKDFSHVDESEWQPADLEKGLDSTLNVVWNEIKYKCRVVKEYGGIPEVVCLASQLNQVFMNLLVNAAQSIEKQGTVTIRTGQTDEAVWVEIADTGSGIAPEHLSRVFEPFFTTKPVGKGTGLGLSLSWNIVQKHGGRIEVESEVGRGSTFRVWVPKARQG